MAYVKFRVFDLFFCRFVDLIHDKKAALQQLQVAARASMILLLLIVIVMKTIMLMLMMMLMLMLMLFSMLVLVLVLIFVVAMMAVMPATGANMRAGCTERNQK
jgi:membrane protein required for beta-lactamase induction